MTSEHTVRASDGWVQSGRAFLWRYTEGERNFPGWHLSGDAPGVESVLDLAGRLAYATFPVSRRIEITSPTDDVLRIPNNRGSRASFVAAAKLRLSYPAGEVSNNHWELVATAGEVRLTLGSRKLALFAAGLKDMLTGKGDYSIGSDSARDSVLEQPRLWFWWVPP